MKGLHPEGNNSLFEIYFFLTNDCSSLNIHYRWVVQLFWAAFDMPMTGVPLKVALGYKKIVFWLFQKNNYDVTLG